MDYENMTKEELIDYINNLSEELNGKYGLVWDKEREAEKIVVECDKYIPILIESKEKNIDNGEVNNLLINGDNFHSLSVLNYTHNESIDMIYIDPPYNTGNKDFTYNDKYVDAEDGYRHSKWLNFMEKRLKLARNLLKKSGVIYISIDDHEFATLKLLCDKIFGERNFITNFIWNKKNGRQNDSKFVSTNTEYVICYAKNIEEASFNLLPRTDELNSSYKNPDNDPRGPWTTTKLDAKSGSPNSLKSFVFPNGVEWKPTTGRFSAYSRETLQRLYDENRIWFGEKGTNVPRVKKFLSEVKQGLVPNTLLLNTEVGTSQKAKEDYKKCLPNVEFDNPKPIDLIKTFLLLSTNENSIVLDFFAGSGTTGQAVVELNNEDLGKRKFILCTNNENNICDNITYQRMKTVITGKRSDNSLYSDGLSTNLKYYKTEFVDYKGTRDQLYYDLTEKCIPMLCIKSDTYELVEKNKEFAIYSNADKTEYSCVYYDIFGESYDMFIDKVKEIKEHKNLYIFSLSEYVNEDNFKGISNYNIEPIPYKILDLYKNVVKMSKEN
ncbi:MAG: site-specific DNA-methyltransferase [Bacilli bacterium]|nr:site-specific DNA-methyltransferase [Bacilli bacterium]